MAEHRVAGHLGVVGDEYDRAIRTFIPSYDRMLSTIVHWLDGTIPSDGLVVDLGAGTGALSAAILDGLPAVRVQLVDVDPNMLETAAARCERYAGRFELRKALFHDELPRCDAVVATLALHHVADHDEKRALYEAVHAALQPGGLVVVGDMLIHPEGPERRRMLADWYAHMAEHGITEAEADAHFAQWAEEDHYVALPDELELIGAAGFPHPDCFWRDGGLAVYGGFRDA
jgi:ubiquinone/menaquinone biosynthesis C-methylase UbiE